MNLIGYSETTAPCDCAHRSNCCRSCILLTAAPIHMANSVIATNIVPNPNWDQRRRGFGWASVDMTTISYGGGSRLRIADAAGFAGSAVQAWAILALFLRIFLLMLHVRRGAKSVISQ